MEETVISNYLLTRDNALYPPSCAIDSVILREFIFEVANRVGGRTGIRDYRKECVLGVTVRNNGIWNQGRATKTSVD